MADALLDPFRDGFTQRALIGVLALGLACGPLGAWLTLWRRAYAVESFAHALLPGLVLAALLGAPLLVGAIGGVLVAALVIALASRDPRIDADTGTTVAVSALLGAGALLALAPPEPVRLRELLFGDLLGIAPASLAAIAALSLLAVGVLALAYRPLSLVAFDRPAARSLGARPARAELLLLALAGVLSAASALALGNLLVLALLLAPGAAATLLSRRLPTVLVLAALIAAFAGVLGLYASYYLETAAGASIALAALALTAVAATVTARRAA